MKYWIAALVTALVTVLIGVYLSQSAVAAEQGSVRVGQQAFTVDVVRSEEDRVQGLSGRPDLEAGTGMLFIFGEPGIYGIWMKEMRFSIDILWISQFGSIVHIERKVSPASYPKKFQSAKPALYVLEIPAGAGQRFSVNMPVYFENILP